MTPDEVDHVLELFDQTEPALQRQIVVALAARCARLQEAIWPGLPKWEPTPEKPQQDFLEACAEALHSDRERVASLEYQYRVLRQIAAHVPGKVFIEAKEAAGFATSIVPANG